MLIVGIAIAAVVAFGMFEMSPGRTALRAATHRRGATTIAFALVSASLLMVVSIAGAAIVPTVQLETAEDFSVLGGQTVTNVPAAGTVLDGSVGVWPGTAITGFPPGVVQPPGTIEAGTPVAQQAQADSTAAYLDALGRPLNATTTADLGGLTLVGGVYAGPSKGALQLTGTVTLDGENDPNSVFIFQTNSSLITASGSNVALINGAQECNVFWQVGSSATLGTDSNFVGNILALTSIFVNNGVTVQGRALAQTGEVTLDNDVFTQPLCDLSAPTTTTTEGEATTTSEAEGGGTATTAPGGGTATTGDLPSLPLTGSSTDALLVLAIVALLLGAGTVWVGRRQRD
jgi:LPXTG-motif cell wall-anchored protein